jgi:ribosomal protein L37AE/L43A
MEAVLPYVALVSAFFAAIAVLFSLIRPRFPARVNCWFCQKDLVVEYHERDSWECPHCEQYNGFTAVS